MKKLVALLGLLVASCLLYLGVFTTVHRPLVVGDITRQLKHKLTYAARLKSPKLLIFAGSNGRFSHRCETIGAALARPCVNASVGVGIGLDFQLAQIEPLLNAGDLVYLPLEYSQYAVSEHDMQAGLHNAALVHDYRSHLHSLDAMRIVRAYASFDLPFLIHGLLEMALDARGFRRRNSLDSLTPQGDERGHTAALAQSYVAFLRNSVAESPTIPESSHAQRVLAEFLDRSRARGVRVIGGLPTVPDTAPIAPADIARLRRLYADHGQNFLVLDEFSRYPLSCFYDTLYHLHETCQVEHSVRVGAGLRDMLR